MKRREIIRIFGGAAVVGTIVPRELMAHLTHHQVQNHWHPPISPHWRPIPRRLTPVQVSGVDVSVQITDRLAVTTMTMSLYNPSSRQQESKVIIPVAAQAGIHEFGLEGAQGKFPGKLIPRDEARKIYDEIVRRSLDPGLLEFAGQGMVKSSVFPVPGRGTSRVRLVYEQILEVDGDRIDYALPRTEAPTYQVPWTVDVEWKIKGGIAGVYSPSHDMSERRLGRGCIALKNRGGMQPGSLLLSATRRKKDNATASIMAYPSAKDAGYFLMLLTPPAMEKQQAVKREVSIVIDKSGSMAGEKIEQALKAAHQVIEGLDDGEAFNVIVYNEAVEQFSAQPVVKSRNTLLGVRRYLAGVRVSGGTNIHDALQAAVNQKPIPDMLPLVLFLTDGVPTIGQTQEKKIRDAIAVGNTHKRRIFTFGVGVDVNTPLLSRLADDSRARATYVLPKENVELKVAQVFRRLSGPILSEPELTVTDGEGKVLAGVVSDMLPAQLPDMFDGEQLVLLGCYRSESKLNFTLKGKAQSGIQEFDFKLSLKKSNRANAHVPRLWAMRKIAVLTEALRDLGAEHGASVNMNDPKTSELVKEIIRLSTEHGVLTEYTAFLAREGMVFAGDMHRRAVTRASAEIKGKAVEKRSGTASLNQDWNIARSKSAKYLNRSNGYMNDRLEKTQVEATCQVADKAFYRNGKEWVDAGLVGEKLDDSTLITVNVSSPEFQKIASRLIADNRQSCLALGENIRISIGQKTYLIQSGK